MVGGYARPKTPAPTMRMEDGGSGSLVPAIFAYEGGVDTIAAHVTGWAWQVGLLTCTSHDRWKYGYCTTKAVVVEDYAFQMKIARRHDLCKGFGFRC